MTDEKPAESPDNSPPAHDPDARAGRVAVVGRPNVGKSTLVNALLGQKLVIATSRPGTTRSSVLAVYAADDPPTQIAFVDTPGLHRPKSELGKLLREEAERGLNDVDAVVLMLEAPSGKGRGDVTQLHDDDERVIRMLADVNAPVLVAINKVDRLTDKTRLLPLLTSMNERLSPAALVPISATKGVNLMELVAELRKLLPEGVLYDPDFLTDRPERFFVSELVREAVFERTRAEIPHGVAVVIDRFLEEGRHTRVEASLVVEKKSHKGIVIGAGGKMLVDIGTSARERIEDFLGRKVVLKLWVKVIPGWTGDPRRVRELALEPGR
ncbi:MAG: GTPase Era [Deltaproteobacteria bacterium]|nr:GTPase Era [Deltaproteobacteria bacterium]